MRVHMRLLWAGNELLRVRKGNGALLQQRLLPESNQEEMTGNPAMKSPVLLDRKQRGLSPQDQISRAGASRWGDSLIKVAETTESSLIKDAVRL